MFIVKRLLLCNVAVLYNVVIAQAEAEVSPEMIPCSVLCSQKAIPILRRYARQPSATNIDARAGHSIFNIKLCINLRHGTG